ncbi:MAG: molybdopterin-binding protein [Deltaproteobacteria bacterium]|nr:molybdopterin-binding protein [Deltaproteobacteria bacterium]
MEWDLLEKTTFWVEGARLKGANLGEVAAAAASALGLDRDEVMVVDVQNEIVAFDVLRRKVDADSIVGKFGEILRRMGAISGVSLSESASVHSEGILGLIALDPGMSKDVISRSEEMGRAVADAVSRKACVFASGSEVIAGNIEDTNSPYLINALTEAGFQAEFGGIIEDDLIVAVNRLEGALMKGFGLILTTGGVGAESKDHSVEAVLRLDPNAYTPWILKFTPDMQRHYKEGVRIAVGRIGISRIITLPGPHAEVRLGCRALLAGLDRDLDDAALAETVASAIRERWLAHMGKDVQHHGH